MTTIAMQLVSHNKFNMSLEKLPSVSFKNTLEKQQIAHRMYFHRKKLLELTLKKPRQSNSEVGIQAYKGLHEENPKKNYFLQSKYTQIERQNRILFQKISKISKPRRKSQDALERVKSLNITFRRKQIQSIENENARMYNRILHQKAFISFKSTDKQFVRNKKLAERISQKDKYKLEDWY